MTSFFKETDSWGMSDSDFTSSSSQQSSSFGDFPSDLSDVTRSDKSSEFLSFSGEPDPTRQAKNILPQIEIESVVKQTESLLFTIKEMVRQMWQERPELTDIPPLRANPEEDGSVLIEWIFQNFRIGFNIEPKPEDSGFYFVSNKEAGDFTQSGPLVDLPSIISNFIQFIYNNI